MTFKKPNNNSKKNKTKKQQKKAAPASKRDNDASSVEEIQVNDALIALAEAPMEEVAPEIILTEEEIKELEEKRRAEEEAEHAHQEYMRQNYYIPAYKEWRKGWEDVMIADLEDPEYWEDRIEIYEGYREKYNKKMSWSAEDMEAIQAIDDEIAEMEDTLDRLYGVDSKPEPQYNAILGGNDWWKTDSSGWVTTK